MSKQEALNKIEELKDYIDGINDTVPTVEEKLKVGDLRHGDKLIHKSDGTERVVITGFNFLVLIDPITYDTKNTYSNTPLDRIISTLYRRA